MGKEAMTLAFLPGATLTGDRIRLTLRQAFSSSSPAVRCLPELNAPPVPIPPPLASTPWIVSALQRLDELAALAPGWDGANAPALNPAYIKSALEFISSDLITSIDAKPDLVPTCDGGLLIEWHTEAVDLIIELAPVGASFYAYDNETNSEVEAALGDRLEQITSAFVKLGLGR